MKIKFSNNASTTLFSTVTVDDTQIVVSPGGGSLFPELTDGNFFMITVVDAQGNLEIMGVTSRNVDTFTVNRAQENTPARAFPEGSVVELRLTAGSIGEMASQLTADILAATQLPRGIITMWSGATNAVPSGWALCDGTANTPDLRNRFIVGAGNSYAPGNTGGALSYTPTVTVNAAGTGVQVGYHTLTEAEIPSHSHRMQNMHYQGNPDNWDTGNTVLSGGNDLWSGATGGSQGHNHPITDNGHAHTASASAVDSRPPYYALAFIMKL